MNKITTGRQVDFLGADRGAVFSPCQKYRYVLWRIWEPKPCVIFIMLNPSTADAETNDPTVERCERFAKAWGYGGYYVLNIFAWRSTDPKGLKQTPYPVGPKNDDYIMRICSAETGSIICAWGNHGKLLNRSSEVLKLLAPLNPTDFYPRICVLKITGEGEPGHPLYLSKYLNPYPYPKEKWAQILK